MDTSKHVFVRSKIFCTYSLNIMNTLLVTSFLNRSFFVLFILYLLLCLSVLQGICLSIRLSFCLCLCLCLCLCHCHCLCLCHSLSLSVFMSLHLCLSFCTSLFLIINSINFYFSLSFSPPLILFERSILSGTVIFIMAGF